MRRNVIRAALLGLGALVVALAPAVAPAAASDVPIKGHDEFFSCKHTAQENDYVALVRIGVPLGADWANTRVHWMMTSKSVADPVQSIVEANSLGTVFADVEFPAPRDGSGRVTLYKRDDQGHLAPVSKTRIAWACEFVPKISAISPESGPSAGGTRVTVSGPRVGTGCRVTFGGVKQSGENCRRLSARRIRVTSPPHALGDAHVRAWGPGGSHAPISVSWRVRGDRFTFQ